MCISRHFYISEKISVSDEQKYWQPIKKNTIKNQLIYQSCRDNKHLNQFNLSNNNPNSNNSSNRYSNSISNPVEGHKLQALISPSSTPLFSIRLRPLSKDLTQESPAVSACPSKS